MSSSAVGQRVAQHRTVLEAAARAGVELVAYTSILRADSTSVALAAEHLATEQILAELGRPARAAPQRLVPRELHRPGPRPPRARRASAAAGDGRISAAARADFAEAAAAALLADDSAGKVHELAGDESFSMAEYAATLAELSGQDVSYVDLPEAEYAAALESAGLPGAYAAILADSDRGISQGELHDDSRTLSALIGRPTTPLADAVKAALGLSPPHRRGCDACSRGRWRQLFGEPLSAGIDPGGTRSRVPDRGCRRPSQGTTSDIIHPTLCQLLLMAPSGFESRWLEEQACVVQEAAELVGECAVAELLEGCSRSTDQNSRS